MLRVSWHSSPATAEMWADQPHSIRLHNGFNLTYCPFLWKMAISNLNQFTTKVLKRFLSHYSLVGFLSTSPPGIPTYREPGAHAQQPTRHMQTPTEAANRLPSEMRPIKTATICPNLIKQKFKGHVAIKTPLWITELRYLMMSPNEPSLTNTFITYPELFYHLPCIFVPLCDHKMSSIYQARDVNIFQWQGGRFQCSMLLRFLVSSIGFHRISYAASFWKPLSFLLFAWSGISTWRKAPTWKTTTWEVDQLNPTNLPRQFEVLCPLHVICQHNPVSWLVVLDCCDLTWWTTIDWLICSWSWRFRIFSAAPKGGRGQGKVLSFSIAFANIAME